MPLAYPSKLNIFTYTVFFIIPILFILRTNLIFAQNDLATSSTGDDALEEELRYLKAETFVITASRIPENIKKSASSKVIPIAPNTTANFSSLPRTFA